MAVAFETAGAVLASSSFTEITAGNNAKSAYSQLVASSGIACKAIYVVAQHISNAGDPSLLIDIATGAAASEVVLIPDLFMEPGPSSSLATHTYWGPFLVDIAASTRYAARVEANTIFQLVQVGLYLASERLPDLSSPSHLAYGITSGSSPKGKTIDPGAVADTKGAYTELTASFSATGEWVWLSFGNNQNAGMDDARWLVDIATGAAASEVVRIADIYIGSDLTDDAIQPRAIGPFPANIFQGARVAARAQCSITNATNRKFNLSLSATAGTVVAGGSGGGMRLAGHGGLAA